MSTVKRTPAVDLLPAVATAAPARPLRGTPPASTPEALLELIARLGASAETVEATDAWLAKRPSAHSRTAYAKDISWWLAWCAGAGVNPAAARAVDADNYATALREVGLAPSTRARRLAAVSSWQAYLVRNDQAERNVFVGMDRPKVAETSPTTGLTAGQLGQLLAYARDHESARTYALFVTLATTASRIGALLGATVGQLGHDQGHRVIRLLVKGGTEKRFVLVPLAVAALESYLADRGAAEDQEALLFATRTGKPMDEPAVLRLIRRVAKAAGIPGAAKLSPHSFRHSYATAMLDLGKPLADVQDALGHADPRTTRRYDLNRGALERSPSYAMQDELAKGMRAADHAHQAHHADRLPVPASA